MAVGLVVGLAVGEAVGVGVGVGVDEFEDGLYRYTPATTAPITIAMTTIAMMILVMEFIFFPQVRYIIKLVICSLNIEYKHHYSQS